MAEATKKTAAPSKSSDVPVKADVSFNDLEKDLDKGNERVLDLLNEHSIKQGYYNPEDPTFDDDKAEQNDPDNTVEKHSAKLSADAVAAIATKDQDKQDKERRDKLQDVADKAEQARKDRIAKFRSDENA